MAADAPICAPTSPTFAPVDSGWYAPYFFTKSEAASPARFTPTSSAVTIPSLYHSIGDRGLRTAEPIPDANVRRFDAMFGASATAPHTTFCIEPHTFSKAFSSFEDTGACSYRAIGCEELRSSSSAAWISSSEYPSAMSAFISSSESPESALAVSTKGVGAGLAVGRFFLRIVFATSASTCALGRA